MHLLLVLFILAALLGEITGEVEEDAFSLFKEWAEGGDSLQSESHGPLLDKLLPPYYDEVKPLHRGFYPVNKKGEFVVDVWDYMQRMSLYKYLLDNTRHCLWSDTTGANPLDQRYDFGNIVWGLPLQHGWQLTSGRLLNEANSTYMSHNSWWAAMNYYLSVIPYLGAVEAGIAPPIEIANTSAPFCTKAEDCADLVAQWTSFFSLLKATANSCPIAPVAALAKGDAAWPDTPIADRFDFNLSLPMEQLLQSLWTAHIRSINTAEPLFEDLLKYLSEPEALFGQSWASFVDLVADTLFPCNFTITNVLQYVLPQRIFHEGDQVPFVKDMRRLENRATLLLELIYKYNEARNGKFERTWEFAMCTEPGRAIGRKMFTFGVFRPVLLVEGSLQLIEIMRNTPLKTQCGVPVPTPANHRRMD
eukprot:gene8687-9571_t